MAVVIVGIGLAANMAAAYDLKTRKAVAGTG